MIMQIFLTVRPLDVYIVPHPMYNHEHFLLAKHNNYLIN